MPAPVRTSPPGQPARSPAWYAAPNREFLEADAQLVLGALARGNPYDLDAEQNRASSGILSISLSTDDGLVKFWLASGSSFRPPTAPTALPAPSARRPRNCQQPL